MKKNYTKLFAFLTVFLYLFPNIVKAEGKRYDVWINGKQITEGTKDDVLDDLDGSKKSVIYTPANDDSPAKLTLNNAIIENEDDFDQNSSAIYSEEENLIIELIGENRLGNIVEVHFDSSQVDKPNYQAYQANYKANYPSFGHGISSFLTNLTITGSGNLTIYDAVSGIEANKLTIDENFTGKITIHDEAVPEDLPPTCGIISYSDVNILSGNIDIISYYSKGIQSQGTVNIKNATVNIKSHDEAIDAYTINIDELLEKINANIIPVKGEHARINNKEENNGYLTIKPIITYVNVTFETFGVSKEIEKQTIEKNTKAEKPENPISDNYEFDGWYEDEKLTKAFDFNTLVNEDITLYAKWNIKSKEYLVNDENNNIVIFDKEMGHTYTLSILDYLKLDEEFLKENDITKEELNKIIDEIKNLTKKNGELISLYEIDVFDEYDNGIHEGLFTLKLKLTDDMKKYDSFKLIYIEGDEENIDAEEPIKLEIKDGFLMGKLPHLSTYALVGTKTSNPIINDNPNTNDNIGTYISIGLVGLIGIVGAMVYLNKKNKI